MPLCLNLRDTQKLAISLLAALEHHGVHTRELIDSYDLHLSHRDQKDDEDLTAVFREQPPVFRPHYLSVPPTAVADWLRGSICPSCRVPLETQNVAFDEWTILARKWASRWTVTCGSCGKHHRLTVTCMPRRMRGGEK